MEEKKNFQFYMQINFLRWVDFFQNNVGCQNNHLPRVKTKQNGMKKAKYLSLICWKEFVLKSGKTEKPTQYRKIIWLHATWRIKFVLILVLTTIFLPLKWSKTRNLRIDFPGGTYLK